MKISLILAHPEAGSFNHAIAEAARSTLVSNGHDISFHDLYLERFDPILPYEEIPKGAAIDPIIQKHCDEIASACQWRRKIVHLWRDKIDHLS